MATAEAACTYAALILHEEGISATAEKIAALVKAANVNVESYWPPLFAQLLSKRSVDDLVASVGSGGGAGGAEAAPAASGAAAAVPAALVVEEKMEEPKEESDDDMGFGLFD